MPTIKNYDKYLETDSDEYDSLKVQEIQRKRFVKEKREALAKKRKAQKQDEVLPLEDTE